MIRKANRRATVKAGTRFVLVCTLFAWLNVNAAPCAMPMAPPMAPQQQAGTSGHGSHHAVQHADNGTGSVAADCVHCPPCKMSIEDVCAGMVASGCDVGVGVNSDGRQGKVPAKDSPGFFAIPHAPPPLPVRRPAPKTLPVSNPGHKFRSGPSLNLRYCVFLK